MPQLLPCIQTVSRGGTPLQPEVAARGGGYKAPLRPQDGREEVGIEPLDVGPRVRRNGGPGRKPVQLDVAAPRRVPFASGLPSAMTMPPAFTWRALPKTTRFAAGALRLR